MATLVESIHRRRLVLEVLHLLEKLVDPHGEGKGGLIQWMHLKAILGIFLLLVVALFAFRLEFFVESEIHILRPFAAIFGRADDSTPFRGR
ncbi:MAG: hypothetical protein WDN28_07920 [Chthoniobacter sp.]